MRARRCGRRSHFVIALAFVTVWTDVGRRRRSRPSGHPLTLFLVSASWWGRFESSRSAAVHFVPPWSGDRAMARGPRAARRAVSQQPGDALQHSGGPRAALCRVGECLSGLEAGSTRFLRRMRARLHRLSRISRTFGFRDHSDSLVIVVPFALIASVVVPFALTVSHIASAHATAGGGPPVLRRGHRFFGRRRWDALAQATADMHADSDWIENCGPRGSGGPSARVRQGRPMSTCACRAFAETSPLEAHVDADREELL